MSYVKAIIKATAATLTPCIGFKPSRVIVRNINDETMLEWYDDYINVSGDRYGIAIAAAGDRSAVNAASSGIVVYDGGDVLAAASTQYLVYNDADQRDVDVAAGLKVTSWTLGSASNKTGCFNCDVTGATIGPGSRIVIGGTLYTITALTAGQGIAANEVTLTGAPKTGRLVNRIWSMYSMTGAALGEVLPAGFTIGASATVNNTDGDLVEIEAWN